MPAGHQDEAAVLRALLAHVYWLGGASGAGKSTVARRPAVRHGLQWYATDTTMAAHARRIGRNNAPYLNEFQAMSMDDRWVNRSPEAESVKSNETSGCLRVLW
jgi:adenylylsulfate kinase-like enzyme